MKIGEIIAKIIYILIVVVPIILVIGVAFFGEKTSPLSAKETYQKALEVLQTQGREAVLTQIETGSIPRKDSISKRAGRGDRWNVCFYSKEEDKHILFENVGEEGVKEQKENVWCPKYIGGINTEKWKIDSEEAVKIAQDKAKKLGKEEFIIVMITLVQREEYLFGWDYVTQKDGERLIEYLWVDLGIDWAKDAKIRKSEIRKTISIFKDKNLAEIMIDEKKEKATLKIHDGGTYDLIVKKEKGKLNIYREGNIPSWEIEFYPPRVRAETTCLRIIINAETGGIIKIEEPVRHYIRV